MNPSSLHPLQRDEVHKNLDAVIIWASPFPSFFSFKVPSTCCFRSSFLGKRVPVSYGFVAGIKALPPRLLCRRQLQCPAGLHIWRHHRGIAVAPGRPAGALRRVCAAVSVPGWPLLPEWAVTSQADQNGLEAAAQSRTPPLPHSVGRSVPHLHRSPSLWKGHHILTSLFGILVAVGHAQYC